MSDLDINPQAVPDRPDPNEFILADWGRWVQDELTMRGLKAYKEITANQTGVAANVMTNVTGLSVTFTAVAGRVYKVSAKLELVPVNPSTVIGTVSEGATNIAVHGGYCGVGGNGYDVYPMRIMQFPAGAHTLQVAGMIVATGGGYFLGAPTNPMFLAVEDIGPV